MKLERILNDFRKKIIVSAIGSLLACSGSDGSQNITEPTNNQTHPKNSLPVINSVCQTKIPEHSYYECIIQATDADGDPISYSIEGPEWLSVSNNFIFGNTPEVVRDSIIPVKIKAFDGKGTTPQSYNLTIGNLFNTYTTSPGDANPLIEATDNSLTFSNPVRFNVGDILGSTISQVSPYGLLREIISISADGRKVNTKQATLEKIIRDGSFSFTGKLSQSNVQSFSSIKEGVSLNTNPSAEPKFGINLNNVILYDVDQNPLTKDDQLIANGRIEIATDFDFNADVKGIKLNTLDFKNKSSITSDIALGSTLTSLASKKEVPLGEYYFSPIIITPPVTPIPVVVVPKIGLYVGVDPTKVNPLSVNVKQDSNLEATLRYDNVWVSSSNFTSNFNFTNPVINGDWNLNVYASPRLTLLFGGVIGTSAGVSTNLRLDASTQTGDWKLYGGLGATLGVSMEIFAKNISAYSKNVIAYEKLLSQGKAQLPALKTDTLYPEKDAYIAWTNIGGLQDINYNNVNLNLRRDEGRFYQTTLIKFLNSLPVNASINSAKLNLYGYCGNNSLDPSVTVSLFKIISDWTENGVTWNTQPRYNSSLTGNMVFPVRVGSVSVEKDITSLVQDWNKNRSQNYGVALGMVDNESLCVLNSRENNDPKTRPRVVVTYR